MRFEYSGADAGLAAAAKFANTLDADPVFWAGVAAQPSFVLASMSPAEIARRLQACATPVRVRHFTSWKPWRRNTVAVTDPNKPFLIAYHTRFLGNGVASKVNTLVHEFVHNVDFFADSDPGLQYTHTEDATPTRPMTAPYRIGWLAQQRYAALIGKAEDKGVAVPLHEDAFDGDTTALDEDELE